MGDGGDGEVVDGVFARLADDLLEARRAVDPAVRARLIAQVQRQSGWALRQAVTECRERLGMTWRDTASTLQVPYTTLYRQYQAGGRLVVGENRDDRRDGAGDHLDLLVLGELVVRSGGNEVALPGPSVRALMGALLLTPGDVVREDRLLELAWGSERGSRRALQCAVHRLRTWLRDLGGTCRLEHSGTGYRLAVPDGAVDLARFRERVRAGSAGDPDRRLALLAAALEDWRGPVLGGRPEWLAADPVVRALEQARVDCAGALADLAFRLGRAGEVVAAVEEVAATAPYDEPLQARLVRLLSACGRHAEALRHVERVRRRLADDLGIAPSREMRGAHAAALHEDGRLGPVPRQLPPDLPDFTGRHEEIQAIGDLMMTVRGPLVFAINGAAGTGKTTLAVHAAHETAALFVNGQLHADLRGDSPLRVLGRFLRALGIQEGALPASFEERVALYRSWTAGRRMLILLDDAADETQVRPLVPAAAGCAVLVTSRVCLAGLVGARLLPLGVPSPDEAVLLLCRASGRPWLAGDPTAERIVRLCDRLPLAVRIAGARLATRPLLTASRLAERLCEEKTRLDELAVHGLSVRAALDSACADLVPAHRQALWRLGDLPANGFPACAAGALLDVATGSAVAHLEGLVDAGLVAVLGADAEGEARYGLPGLVRLYAREHGRHG
ncbi:BTAD domain-containing putative transcriptional regulator [Spirillospora sp. CA-294931]|uniref:AfsR/SARP family transcriptional regulator n=1 Tax=Spirillospora sp. CA-294931 TaxID=3240042 RepID=UPI003D8F9079